MITHRTLYDYYCFKNKDSCYDSIPDARPAAKATIFHFLPNYLLEFKRYWRSGILVKNLF